MSIVATDKKQHQQQSSYTIVFIEENDHQAVMEFLAKTFFIDSVLSKSFAAYPCKEMDDWCANMLSQKCSFKAINQDGQIIGVYLNTAISSKEPYTADPEKCANPRYKKQLYFFEYVAKQFNIWEQYPDIERAFEAGVLSVDPEYRGLGIAKQLTQRTLDYAQEAGFPVVMCHCSSLYSTMACLATGFIEVVRIAYTDYVVDGEHPIPTEHPHTHFSVLIKKLKVTI